MTVGVHWRFSIMDVLMNVLCLVIGVVPLSLMAFIYILMFGLSPLLTVFFTITPFSFRLTMDRFSDFKDTRDIKKLPAQMARLILGILVYCVLVWLLWDLAELIDPLVCGLILGWGVAGHFILEKLDGEDGFQEIVQGETEGVYINIHTDDGIPDESNDHRPNVL